MPLIISLSCATATVHAQLTLNPPATSTKTAKLVRCALEHCTAVRFPMTLISSVATPVAAQLPLPILYTIMHTWNNMDTMHASPMCNLRIRKIPKGAEI